MRKSIKTPTENGGHKTGRMFLHMNVHRNVDDTESRYCDVFHQFEVNRARRYVHPSAETSAPSDANAPRQYSSRASWSSLAKSGWRCSFSPQSDAVSPKDCQSPRVIACVRVRSLNPRPGWSESASSIVFPIRSISRRIEFLCAANAAWLIFLSSTSLLRASSRRRIGRLLTYSTKRDIDPSIRRASGASEQVNSSSRIRNAGSQRSNKRAANISSLLR